MGRALGREEFLSMQKSGKAARSRTLNKFYISSDEAISVFFDWKVLYR